MTPERHIPLIVDLHAEDAAFLWLQRDRAVDAPHYNRKFLARLDERLEANLDGLRVAGDAGWERAFAALQRYTEPGEVFTAAVLALESRDARRIDAVTAVIETEPTTRAFVSALGWVGAPRLHGTVSRLLADPRPHRRMLGVAACSVHRVDPGALLPGLLQDHPTVQARSLRLAGELGRSDLCHIVFGAIGLEGPCGFWAAWAAGLLGDRQAAVHALQQHSVVDGPYRSRALQLLLRIMDGPAAVAWLRDVGREPANARLLVEGAGILGDPVYVPWLLRCTEEPQLARVAGESFSMITGADLAYESLDGDSLEGAPGGPTDDPEDANVELDPDENLPWPQPALVQRWWNDRSGDIREGRRLLLGREMTGTALREIFRTAFQRQRRAAALEMALRSPELRLANWRERVSLSS